MELGGLLMSSLMDSMYELSAWIFLDMVLIIELLGSLLSCANISLIPSVIASSTAVFNPISSSRLQRLFRPLPRAFSSTFTSSAMASGDITTLVVWISRALKFTSIPPEGVLSRDDQSSSFDNNDPEDRFLRLLGTAMGSLN